MTIKAIVVGWRHKEHDLLYSDREMEWFDTGPLKAQCIPLVDQSLLAQANLRIAQLEKQLAEALKAHCLPLA